MYRYCLVGENHPGLSILESLDDTNMCDCQIAPYKLIVVCQ